MKEVASPGAAHRVHVFPFPFPSAGMKNSLLWLPTQACLQIVRQMFQNEAESLCPPRGADFPASCPLHTKLLFAMVLWFYAGQGVNVTLVIELLMSSSQDMLPVFSPIKMYWPACSQHDSDHFCLFGQAVEQTALFQKAVIP